MVVVRVVMDAMMVVTRRHLGHRDRDRGGEDGEGGETEKQLAHGMSSK